MESLSAIEPQAQTPGLWLLVVAAFFGISLVIFAVGRLLAAGRNRPQEVVGSRRPLALGSWTEPFAGLFSVRQATREKLKKDLLRAGYFHRRAVDEFLALRNAALAAWLVLTACAAVFAVEPDSDQLPRLLALGGGVLVLIYSTPRIVLASQAAARTRRIHHALPDALDMITMSMGGGVPMQRAIDRVGRELATTHPDLACELTILHHQAETGSLEQALVQFAYRVDVPEVTALAALVSQAERLGGNVAGPFRDFADSVRRTRRQRAEEQGNKSSVKLLFPVVLCLAPPIYILLLGPAALELRDFVNRENGPGGVLAPSLSRSGTSNTPAPLPE